MNNFLFDIKKEGKLLDVSLIYKNKAIRYKFNPRKYKFLFKFDYFDTFDDYIDYDELFKISFDYVNSEGLLEYINNLYFFMKRNGLLNKGSCYSFSVIYKSINFLSKKSGNKVSDIPNNCLDWLIYNKYYPRVVNYHVFAILFFDLSYYYYYEMNGKYEVEKLIYSIYEKYFKQNYKDLFGEYTFRVGRFYSNSIENWKKKDNKINYEIVISPFSPFFDGLNNTMIEYNRLIPYVFKNSHRLVDYLTYDNKDLFNTFVLVNKRDIDYSIELQIFEIIAHEFSHLVYDKYIGDYKESYSGRRVNIHNNNYFMSILYHLISNLEDDDLTERMKEYLFEGNANFFDDFWKDEIEPKIKANGGD